MILYLSTSTTISFRLGHVQCSALEIATHESIRNLRRASVLNGITFSELPCYIPSEGIEPRYTRCCPGLIILHAVGHDTAIVSRMPKGIAILKRQLISKMLLMLPTPCHICVPEIVTAKNIHTDPLLNVQSVFRVVYVAAGVANISWNGHRAAAHVHELFNARS